MIQDKDILDMNKIVGNYHILFVCIDSLRFDIAYEEEKNGGIPILNRYGSWRKCQAAGNFTYPSHQAMFAGFLPIDEEINEMKKREKLFFSADIGMGRKAPEEAFLFSQPTWVQGLADIGYETYCIGGLSFFDKRTQIGSVMPSYFQHSYWNPSFGCQVKDSAKNQIDFVLKKLSMIDDNKKIMMYINICAIHYPNYFYSTDETKDSVNTHRLALRYVDSQLGRLFDGFAKKGNTFVICCSDHGTCYGEDGVWYHGINHPIVNTVPYKHFIIEKEIKDTNWQYMQYMYSYPHKTAYYPLPDIKLEDKLPVLIGQSNSLYFHIPFCQHKCGYCNLFSVAGMENNVSFIEDYVNTMEKHAAQISEVMPGGISFNETDYKYLKAVIEGGLEKKPKNVLIYATSNRRHLIREKTSDKNDRDEDLHTNDTVQEKLSLAYRFGVTIYFGKPAPKEFQNIVRTLAKRYDIAMEEEILLAEANKWELSHGGLSGRTAQQFIDYLLGKAPDNG